MTSSELRQKYLKFFESKGHKVIPSASLVPENDPTTLFTSAGMQQLVPYLKGQLYPGGAKRLVNSQPCFRSQDIDEVGDNRHTTFFEMLGDWILGEEKYKETQLTNLFIFLTNDNQLNLDPTRLYFTVFAGDKKSNAPKDSESEKILQNLLLSASVNYQKIGIDTPTVNINPTHKMENSDRIFYYGPENNWWSRSGTPEEMLIGDIGGPDSEVFYDFDPEGKINHQNSPFKDQPCHPNCDCGRFLEIGNSVFIEYEKTQDGFVPLKQSNVDFGGGLERLTAATENKSDIFEIDLFRTIIETIEEYTQKKYTNTENQNSIRVIADHMKAAVFLIVCGVQPSNKLQGYVLRRLLRRSAIKMHKLGGGLTPLPGLGAIAESVLTTYDGIPGIDRKKQRNGVEEVVKTEINKFGDSLDKGLKQIEKLDEITGKAAFDLYQTYGFPIEVTEELLSEKGQQVDKKEFEKEFEKHKELSRTASAGMFKGGLGEQSEITTKYHTTTHLLHAALRKILGEHVQQKGSNITAERLRFDFSHQEKMTEEQIKEVADLVNQAIKENLQVSSEVMNKEEALKSGALGFFTDKYGNQVTVYTIDHPEQGKGSPFSKEICGGPHVQNTGELGTFKIIKEESASSGIRRIYATLS